MRKLPLLLALLLIATFGTAATAQASIAPLLDRAQPLLFVEEEEGEEAESEDEGAETEEAEEGDLDRELCEEDPELFCDEEEEAASQAQAKKGDECSLKSARAAINVNPGKRRLRLSVHYRTWKPVGVEVEASFEAPNGAVQLGTDHARFRRSGVYRDTFSLPEKKMKKALAAKGFTVELSVPGEPASCGLELTAASRRAKR